MDTFLRFLYEFLSQFFNGIKFIVLGIFRGFKSMFNIPEYIKVVNEYKNDFIPVTFWNVYAQNIAQYCAKGDIVGVKGRLVRRAQVIGEKTVYTSEVVGERIIFIHLKSFYEKFKDLRLRDEAHDDFDEPSYEELKKMVNSIEIRNDSIEQDDICDDDFEGEKKSKKGKKTSNDD